MVELKCRICGGNLQIIDKRSYATCESCGSKMTLPNMNDDRIVNLFNRANHYCLQNEFDKAMATYENILAEDNSNAEAHWGLVLAKYGIEYVEEPNTHKRVPTCHRLQYESILTDLDYKEAIKNSRDDNARILYEREAKQIAEIQKNILAVARNEESYDIFICYKETDNKGQRTKDSIFAQDIYNQLVQEKYKVFFSRITLEDKLGTAYEPYIFSALNSAKIMLVIGTTKENFEAVWVKNEWSRFLELLRKEKNRIIIPCYREMDAYDLPEELSLFQAQDMNKIGFMQDLIHGISKIIGQKPEEIKKMTEEQNSEYEFEKEKIIRAQKEEILNQQKIEENNKPRKIIVSRNAAWIGMLCKMICYINNEEICRLSENESFEIELKKGVYNFKCRLTLGNPMSNTYEIDLNSNYIARISVTQESSKPRAEITYQREQNVNTSNVSANNYVDDKQTKFENLLLNARKAVNDKNWAYIEKCYSLLQEEFPKNIIIEATFFRTVAKVMRNNSLDNYQKRNELCNALDVIERYYDVTENKKEVLNIISDFLFKMAFPNIGNYDPKFYDIIIIFNNRLEKLSKTHNEEYIYNLILKNKQMINTKNTVNGRIGTYSREEGIRNTKKGNKNIKKFGKFVKMIWYGWILILAMMGISLMQGEMTFVNFFALLTFVFLYAILPGLIIKLFIKLVKIVLEKIF